MLVKTVPPHCVVVEQSLYHAFKLALDWKSSHKRKMKPILEFDPKLLHIMSDDVLSKIRAGASSWEEDVPKSVAKAIKAFELFGYHKKEVKV